MSKMFYGGIYCQKLTVERAIACLRWIQLLAEKRKWLPHTIKILLQNATYGNITSVTRDVYLSHRVWVYQKGSVCQYLFGNADSAFWSHFKSKFDFGDSLLWPSLAAVNKLFNDVNFAAHCGMKRW